MQVSVESTGALERRLTVTVDEDQISDAVQDRLQKLSRTVKMKGFRAGKVPMTVVRQRYGDQVRQEVLGEVLQSSFYEAVNQEQLRPAGTPAFDTKTTEPGLEYTATFEVYPEVELQSVENTTVERPQVDIGEEDIDKMLETIRTQHKQWEEVERPAEDGDRLIMDYVGRIDGEPFEGGTGSDVTLELGQGRMIPGFEDGLKGAKAGETRTLDVTFPEDYHAEQVAGKPAQFEVTVKKVEQSVLPEVNAEFLKQFGIEGGDVAAFREEIRNNMERELADKIKTTVKQHVMDALLESHPLEIPQSLIDSEAQNLARQMAQNLMQQGIAQDQAQLDPSVFADQARRRVALGLIMAEIVKQKQFSAEPAKVREQVEQIAQAYDHPEEVIKWYYGDRNRLSEVESLVLEQQVVDWVLENAKVDDKPMKFDELMYSKQ
jgi:trigger factor